MDKFGLTDVPISKFENESLGLIEYAESLTEFVKKCDTPMTIALQGDWGSGKTSLMNLIESSLKEDSNIETIEFNTWQYSQFDQSENLVTSLIVNFINKLSPSEENPNKKMMNKILRGFATFGKAAMIGAASTVNLGEAAKGTLEAIHEIGMGKNPMDSAARIKELKEKLESIVKDKTRKGGKERIVVFVDDLDRLIPQKAVELLESLKLFLDLNGCVFVLACDYHVVLQGLKTKFGDSIDEIKGRNFFDKIIQLPFNMPVSQYKVEQYFGNLLKNIEVECNESDLPLYVAMVDYSIGFNPRSMKRLFNSLLLLKIVVKKKFEVDKEKMRMLFGILCMQNAYEPLYEFLIKNEITDELFSKLKDLRNLDLEENESFKYLIEELTVVEDDSKYMKLRHFIEIFYRTIQLESDSDISKLNQAEINNLKEMLTFSSVVSREEANQSINLDEKSSNRQIVKNVIKNMNVIFQEPLNKINLQVNRFRLYQEQAIRAALYLVIKKDDMWFSINLYVSTNNISISFYSKNKISVTYFKDWVKENITPVIKELSFTNELSFAFMEKKLPDGITLEQKEELFGSWAIDVMNKVLPILEKAFPKPDNKL